MTYWIGFSGFTYNRIQFRPRYPADNLGKPGHVLGLGRQGRVTDTIQDRSEESTHSFCNSQLPIALNANWWRDPEKQENGTSGSCIGHKGDVLAGQLFRLEAAVLYAFGFNQCVGIRSFEDRVGLNHQTCFAGIRTQTEVTGKEVHLQVLHFCREFFSGCIGTMSRAKNGTQEVAPRQEIEAHKHFRGQDVFPPLPAGPVVLGFLPRNLFE